MAAAVLLGLGGIAFILLMKTEPLTAAQLPHHAPDIERGKILYIIGGCISCHKPAETAGRDIALPSGGRPLHTPIGTIYPPNITPDKATGIGNWSTLDFVNAPGHCGECHTPRNIFLVPDKNRHLAGGPHPEGKGRVPSLRNLIARKRYADAEELTSAMRFGETMGFDRLSSGGMGDVQANLAMLPEEDVRAIAEYLITLK